jgi:lipopolysaccharide transport system permease protein
MKDNEDWTSIIEPRRPLFDFNLAELWAYRDMIALLVRRDFVAYYKQTVLGPLWFLLQPVLTTLVFTVVFGKIANIPTDGIPHVLFYMSGIVMWNFFADGVNKTSNTFIANAGLFGKVYFPRLSVPVSVIFTNGLTFIIQFALLLALAAFFAFRGVPIHFGRALLIAPFLLLQLAILGLGFGILISALTTRYRDLRFLMTFGVQLWMYATPIVYPLSKVSDRWKLVVALNPVTPVVETMRWALLDSGTVTPTHLASGIALTLFLLLVGAVVFNRIEGNFLDTV